MAQMRDAQIRHPESRPHSLTAPRQQATLTTPRKQTMLTTPRQQATLTAPRQQAMLTAPREQTTLTAPREQATLTAPREKPSQQWRPSTAKNKEIIKVLHSTCFTFGKLSSGHRTGKAQCSSQSQRKAMPKNVKTTAQLHSPHMLAK